MDFERGASFMTGKEEKTIFTNKGPLKTNTLKNQAYQQIKDAILYRRLKLDVIYSQDDICQGLGISRTPVREALIELQTKGFVTFVRGRGFMIKPLSRKEALDIVEMRKGIEMFGVELAASRITDEQLVDMRGLLNQMAVETDWKDSVAMYKLDYAFHEKIFEATGNVWMMHTNKVLRENFLRVETQSAFAKKVDANHVLKEHEAVLLALEERNPAKARKAMEKHMNMTYKRTVNKILEQQ